MSTTSYVGTQTLWSGHSGDALDVFVYHLEAESKYETLSHAWESSDETDSDSIVEDGAQNLLTDSRLNDNIIICRRKYPDEYSTSCKNQRGVLYERVSLSTRDRNARLFRCSKIDLPDLIEWLDFQQRHAYNIYQQPADAVLDDLEALSDGELDRCSSTIGCLLRTRTVADLQLILLACYLVTNSMRTLSVCELENAVREIAKTRFPGGSNFMMEERDLFRERELIRLVWTVIRVDRDLKVTFAEPSMGKFLKSVSLPGVERGHTTMAQMCLGEMRRFGSAVIVQPWHRFRTWSKSYSNWPLMDYATKYWSCHVREASPTRPDVTAELFNMVNYGVARTSPSDTPVHLQRRVLEVGYNVSKIYDLPCLTQLYLNLGAVGTSSIVHAPSSAAWQRLKPASHHELPLSRPGSSIRDKTHHAPAEFRDSHNSPKEILPDLESLQISTEGRSKHSEDYWTSSVVTPEDVDGKEVGESRDSDSWEIVALEDYATC